jgi:hypothetical protein
VTARGSLIPLLALAALLLAASGASADDTAAAPPASPANKLTFAYYAFSSGTSGFDINIRHSFATSTAWVGGYHENDGFDQARVGYEYDYRRDWLTFVPSVLAASHSFVGVSVYSEVGRHLFGIGGAGRTNLNPYWNLGFDPNDYIQFGGGYRDELGNTASVFAIRDNRLDTGQTNTHMFVRRHVGRDWRWTVDVVREHGLGDGGVMINAWAASVDADWRRWFVRASGDQHVNYTPDHQVRIAGGVRF